MAVLYVARECMEGVEREGKGTLNRERKRNAGEKWGFEKVRREWKEGVEGTG